MLAFALMQVCESDMLADVEALTYNAMNRLVVVEHTYTPVASVAHVVAEQTRWSAWRCDSRSGRFEKAQDSTLALPVASALAVGLAGGHLLVLGEVNQSTPGSLLRVALRDDSPLPRPEESATSRTVHLPPAEADRVRLGPEETWSVTTLPCPEWLFNPSLLAEPTSGDPYLAFNTADAQCLVLRARSEPNAFGVVAFLPGYLEPSVQELNGRVLLFGRRPPLPWSVFFHSVRYSGQYGPTALPLWCAELEATGGDASSRNLTQVCEIGEVFLYAVASDGQKALALATVGGSKTEPKLRLHVARDAVEHLTAVGETTLPAIPRRLTVAVSPSRVMVGLTIQGTETYEVHAMEVTIGQ